MSVGPDDAGLETHDARPAGAVIATGARPGYFRRPDAGIAQLVEHNLAKVGVAGSSPVSRSRGLERIEDEARVGRLAQLVRAPR